MTLAILFVALAASFIWAAMSSRKETARADAEDRQIEESEMPGGIYKIEPGGSVDSTSTYSEREATCTYVEVDTFPPAVNGVLGYPVKKIMRKSDWDKFFEKGRKG